MIEKTSVSAGACAATNYTKKKLNLLIAALFMLAFAITIPSASAQTFNVLHEFTNGSDGAFPAGALVRDAAGNLFGMTSSGGGATEGAVYKIDSTGEETILFTFNNTNGGFPSSALVQDDAGNLYGTADEGTGGAGIVFKLSPDGQQTVLHAFQGGLGRNPRVPSGALLLDKTGNIFGTTLFGGNGSCNSGCGSIYRLDTTGKMQFLYTFTGGADGNQPAGPLVQDAAGNLYGVAQFGGDLACPDSTQTGCGTVFKLDRTRKLTVLHTFQGGDDGAIPQPGLLLDANGSLFGTARVGGDSENGTIFRISSKGQYSVLHRFTGKDGTNPNGGLVSDPAGNLYGTTQVGGLAGSGTVFELRVGGLKVLHTFTGGLDGSTPLAGLIIDAAGNLYGTAFKNFLVQQQDGDVFEITP